MRTVTITFFLLVCPTLANALDVRFQPAEVVYAYANNGEGTPTGLYTTVLQNVALLNTSNEPVTIESVRLEVEAAGRLLQTHHVSPDALTTTAKTFHAYAERGILEAYDFQFQTSRYLEGVSFSDSTTLGTNEAIVLQRLPFLQTELPDTVTAIVAGSSASGASVEGRASLRVVDHRSPNEYHFPLRGRWMAAAAPSLHSHHRWASIQEFALDLVRLGDGTSTHEGDGSRLEQYYAFGAPVHAIGDGVVVAASGTMTESSDNLRQPGESDEAYSKRSMAAQQKLLADGFNRVLGNYVVIEHPHGEYSHYLHLRKGSVEVAMGDKVRRGQEIGALGHSGNSTEPHLHFHLTDGPDRLYSRSIPIEFANISLWPADDGTVRHLHSGQILVAE